MGSRRIGNAASCQHPGQLVNTFLVVESKDTGGCSSLFGLLGNPEMVMPLGSHLRQMSNAEYLLARCYLAKFGADGGGDGSTDAGINLIEYKGGNIGFRQDLFQRKHEAGKLATGCYLAKWTRCFARIWGKQYFSPLHAAGPDLRQILERDLDPGLRHCQLVQFRDQRNGQTLCIGPSL